MHQARPAFPRDSRRHRAVAGLTRLFAQGASLASRRMVLRPLTATDLDAPWLAGALQPEWQLADIEAHLATAIAADDLDGSLLGVAIALPGAPRSDAATLAFVGIEPARRYAGLGAELVMAVETLI